LTDRVGNPNDPGVYSLGKSGTWNLLPEGEHVTIVLKNLRFIGQSEFKRCGNSGFSLTNPYLWPSGWDMSHMRDGGHVNDGFMDVVPSFFLSPNGYYFEYIWNTVNGFRGFSLSESDVTDIAPQTQGKADSANLTFKYIATSAAAITPFTISQFGGLPELVSCPTIRYQAVVTLPPGLAPSESQYRSAAVALP
jgi:hypothetical protein